MAKFVPFVPSPSLKAYLGDLIENSDIFRTPSGWRSALDQLFEFCVHMHGPDAARALFTDIGKPITRREISAYENLALLNRYWRMEKPNISELARQVARERKGKSGRGAKSNSQVALDKQIRRIIKKYRS